ncbi:hypothetical protein FQN54_000550 [Arachnomyces sp. PD_36]|nr:hypothetical protein FQN54_000550 [Arachnomyces sp. PD_36]
MTSFIPTELFGGAIKSLMPQGYIDSSQLREIPDHQEIYLSPTTLTNIIIEINQRVGQDENIHDDKSAARYHIRDICDNDDTFDESLFDPQPTTIAGFPSGTAAYHGQVRIKPADTPTSVADPSAAVPGAAVASSSSGDGLELEKKTTTCHYLLIRLQGKETDILVLVNVPHSELVNASGAVERENTLASTILEQVRSTFEIKDMSLFGE